jgi:hypothetical protein
LIVVVVVVVRVVAVVELRVVVIVTVVAVVVGVDVVVPKVNPPLQASQNIASSSAPFGQSGSSSQTVSQPTVFLVPTHTHWPKSPIIWHVLLVVVTAAVVVVVSGILLVLVLVLSTVLVLATLGAVGATVDSMPPPSFHVAQNAAEAVPPSTPSSDKGISSCPSPQSSVSYPSQTYSQEIDCSVPGHFHSGGSS